MRSKTEYEYEQYVRYVLLSSYFRFDLFEFWMIIYVIALIYQRTNEINIKKKKMDKFVVLCTPVFYRVFYHFILELKKYGHFLDINYPMK